MDCKIRKGRQVDIPALYRLIKELAVYEKAGHEVSVTEKELLEDGFGNRPLFEFFVAETGDAIRGIALYYYKYSTWKGKALYLEDIVVDQQYRRSGIGSQLFLAVKSEAQKNKVRRMEWQVLEWNDSAIAFYKKHQAELDEEWINCKFREEALRG